MQVKPIQNLFYRENTLRVTLGVAIIAWAAHIHLWWLIPAGLLLVYTGAHSFCPIYAALGVNNAEAKKNYFVSQIPAHNPEPAYLFDGQGKLAYRNRAAETILPQLTDLAEIAGSEAGSVADLIREEKTFFTRFETGDRNYLVHFRAVAELNAVLGYAFNVTDVVRANEEVIQTQKELIYRLGEIGETRSKETGNHVKRVAEYSYLLARLYGMKEEEAAILKMASPMHDIGKVGIPDSILNKPGKLDAGEWEVMKSHAVIGRDLLAKSDRPILNAAAIVAGEHHEKWDGSGYPEGKKGEEIHVYGRITAVADVFDALGSDRVYKKAWSIEKVVELFIEEKGRHFEPELVSLLITNLDQFLVIRERYRDAV